ncbi:HPP family protein [Acinetobacter sp. CFCC 10889]|uniref:HPP family protein n=1 Tax=Acinetobacter sp. CFCC 10889 TaxID=1775557 RepID=UPI000DD008CD|nr:HPP family protein [Acinetobacter sp. CFCC 10889]
MMIFAGREKLAPRPKFIDIFRGWLSGSLSILILLMLGKWSGHIWIMAPFGASCVLLYSVAQSPLAQPRNIIFGHFISALVGLICLKFFAINIWSIALSVGIAIALMQACRCVHPPAGANPLVILLTANTVYYDWSFLIFPVLLGAIALVVVAFVVNNIKATQKWPIYGLALCKTKSVKLKSIN